MKKTIIVLALIMAVTANAQIEYETFRISEALGVAQTSGVRVIGMLEGIYVQFSNVAAYAVSGAAGDPVSIGQYKHSGTFESSNSYVSLDGTWTLRLTNSTWSIYYTDEDVEHAAAWTNDIPAQLVGTSYYPNAFATGTLTVAASTATETLALTAYDVNGNSRVLFTNSAVASSGYYPIRVRAYNSTMGTTNEDVRIPVMDEWLVVNAKGAESNIATTIRTILNEN